MLSGAPPVPPSTEVNVQVSKLFRTAPLTPEETTRLDAALAGARAVPPGKRCKINPRAAAKQAAQLRPNSGPGPSGWRNSYIQAIAASPAGTQALSLWATHWSSGTITPKHAEIWTPSLVRPFYKSDGVSIRPVICSEALMKYAVAAAMTAMLPRMGAAFGPRQYGAGRAGGAERELYEVRAKMRCQDTASTLPEDQWIIATLDLTNAFGNV